MIADERSEVSSQKTVRSYHHCLTHRYLQTPTTSKCTIHLIMHSRFITHCNLVQSFSWHVWCTLRSHGDCGKGANTVVSQLHYFFELGVYLHAALVKIKTVVCYSTFVGVAWHTKITISFMVGGFSSRGIEKLTSRTSQQLSMSPRCVTWHSREDGTTIVPVYDWTTFFATRMGLELRNFITSVRATSLWRIQTKRLTSCSYPSRYSSTKGWASLWQGSTVLPTWRSRHNVSSAYWPKTACALGPFFSRADHYFQQNLVRETENFGQKFSADQNFRDRSSGSSRSHVRLNWIQAMQDKFNMLVAGCSLFGLGRSTSSLGCVCVCSVL